MRVVVWVKETPIEIEVGPGQQRLKWLALTAAQRFDAETSTGGFSQAQVPTGLLDSKGTALPPNKSIRVALREGQHVFATMQSDEDDTIPGRTAKGTSKFLTTQGAAPAECLLDGYGLGYAIAGQPSSMYLTARDTYANFARNGGETFTVSVEEIDKEEADKYAAKTQEPGPEASIKDMGNGTYVLSCLLSTKGLYVLSILLDGEPIAESPLRTVAVGTSKVPSMIKWLIPRVSGEVSKFEHAVSATSGHELIVFGGKSAGAFSGELRILNIDEMKWSAPRTTGRPPSARAGAAHALTSQKLVLYGGEGEEGMLDSCYAYDVRNKAWAHLACRGVSPGPLAYAAAAAIGSKIYLFGGNDGTAATAKLYVLDLSSLIWDAPEDGGSSALPEPRMNHTLTPCREQLIMYGGRGADGKAVVDPLAIYDITNEAWSVPQCRGEVPHGRWGHSAFIWGNRLIAALGAEHDRESNVVSSMVLDNYFWEACDGNITRVGQACHLIEGKFYVAGGRETTASDVTSNELFQLNLGGFMIEMDGVDDEIMIPHLPTIIPNAYTMEAWIKPAKLAPMNIFCRSDEAYPMAAWSHQLRINAAGRLEHYLEADDKYTVFHTVNIVPGHWYHVAGIAQASGEMKLLVNGKEEGQAVDIGGLRQGLDRYFLGAATGDGMGPFEGSIAEVRVWNYAQSEEEVKDNMRKVLSGAERGIVGYWRLNEGPGGLVFDHSNYGNIGLIKGDPKWAASTVPVQQL